MAATGKIVVVVHATSKQGTSVVNSLLQTAKFAVRALTRDASSDSALLCAPAHPAKQNRWQVQPLCTHPNPTAAPVQPSCLLCTPRA